MGELPADAGVGDGEVRVARRVARLVRRRAAGRRRTRALPQAARGWRATSPTCPKGPVLDWAADDLGDWLTPMTEHLRAQGAFGVRMGPPVVTRRWSADQVKAGIADDSVRSLAEIAPPGPVGDRRPRRPAAGGARLATPGRGGRVRRRPAAVHLRHPARRRRRHAAYRGRRARRHEPALAPQHPQGRQGRRHGLDRHRRGPQGVPRPLRPHRRARPLHAAAAGLLRDDVRRAGRGRPGPDHPVAGPPRGRPGRPPRSRSASAGTRGTPTAPRPPTSATSAAPTPSSGR